MPVEKVRPGTLRSGNCGGNRGRICALDPIRSDSGDCIVIHPPREHTGIRIGEQRDGRCVDPGVGTAGNRGAVYVIPGHRGGTGAPCQRRRMGNRLRSRAADRNRHWRVGRVARHGNAAEQISRRRRREGHIEHCALSGSQDHAGGNPARGEPRAGTGNA